MDSPKQKHEAAYCCGPNTITDAYEKSQKSPTRSGAEARRFYTQYVVNKQATDAGWFGFRIQVNHVAFFVKFVLINIDALSAFLIKMLDVRHSTIHSTFS
jgi:LPS sulfotransferase NodH